MSYFLIKNIIFLGWSHLLCVLSVFYKTEYLFTYFMNLAVLKSQRQIWDILHRVSSLRVNLQRKLWFDMTSSFQSRIFILSKEVECLFWVSLAYNFRKIFFIGQNLKHIHMACTFLKLLIFFWLTLVNNYCLEFISHYIKVILYIITNSKGNK